MAQINDKKTARIQTGDGTLISSKGDRSSLISWRITFCGALLCIVALLLVKPDPYWRIFKFFPDGILVTFQVTVLSIIFATAIGLLAGLGQIVRNSLVNRITVIYIEIIRGIPLLVQLFYIYYALGKFVKVEGMVAAVTAMAICYGA